MSTALSALLIFIGVGIGVWLFSFVMEALRPVPREPQRLRWAPDLPVEHVDVGGNTLRYIKTGRGPNLVLLHTLRTQLDLFEKVIPELSRTLPSTRWIIRGTAIRTFPRPATTRPFSRKLWKAFSIGSICVTLPLPASRSAARSHLIVAARRNPRVARVVAINPYDYAKGRGMARSSLFGGIVTYASLLPVIGETVMRLRNFLIMRSGL